MRGTVSGIRSLYGLFKVLKCNHQHGHFCHFVYIEYYSAGDIFTKFVKFYPLARFASSRCSELSAAFGDLRACYRGRIRITVALASAVIQRWRHFYKICKILPACSLRELPVFRALGRLRRPSSMLQGEG